MSNRIFWGFIKVTTATQLLCGIALLLHFLAVIGFFLRTNESFYDYFDIVRVLLGIVAYVLAFVGIHLVKPRFIIVYLIWLGSRIVYHSGVIFFTLISYYPDSPLGQLFKAERRTSLSADPQYILLRSVLMVLLYIFIFNLVYKCFKYVARVIEERKYLTPATSLASIIVIQEGQNQV
uniref:Uncharacterized protein n=1 Tax=Panagrolaimus davidi TaxID=227884 RepID=A0A914PFD9_9BILA